MWKKLALSIQKIGMTITIAGIFASAFALASGEIIPIISTQVSIAGCIVAVIGYADETYLDWLSYERYEKRIIKRPRYKKHRNKKSA